MMMLAYVFIASVAALVLGGILLRLTSRKGYMFAFTSAILAILLVLSLALQLSGSGSTYFNLLSFNQFSLFFAMLFTAGVLLVNVLAYARSRDYGNFALLVSFALVGMYLVAFSTSLISIFLGLELMSLPSVFLVLLSKRDSVEATVKLFIMAALSVAALSLAIVLVYGASGTLTLQQVGTGTLMGFAFVLFVASLGFEASVFPFNLLLPDVYQGAGAHVTALLGGVNKKVGFAALLQVLIFMFVLSKADFLVIAVLAVATMFYGNLAALLQTDLKRLLAYSSISQAGYILVGIAVATEAGIGGSLVQIFAHLFLFIGAMGVVAWLESKGRSDIDGVLGLYKDNRFMAVALSIFLLSMIGLPFTTGFVGKFLIFLSAVNGGLALLAILGIVNSVISVFYYAKVLTSIYTSKLGGYRMRVDAQTAIVVGACVVVTVLFGVYPQPMVQLASGAASYLFAAGV